MQTSFFFFSVFIFCRNWVWRNSKINTWWCNECSFKLLDIAHIYSKSHFCHKGFLYVGITNCHLSGEQKPFFQAFLHFLNGWNAALCAHSLINIKRAHVSPVRTTYENHTLHKCCGLGSLSCAHNFKITRHPQRNKSHPIHLIRERFFLV